MTDRFVARLNIEHFRRKLATETDEAKRKTLVILLEEEEAELATLEAQHPENKGKEKRG